MDHPHHARRRLILLAAILTTPAHAASHYVNFINDDSRTIVGIATAPTDSGQWRPLDLGGPLIGGDVGQATVEFDTTAACKEDLRVTYRDGEPLTIIGFDACRTASLHLGQARLRAIRRP